MTMKLKRIVLLIAVCLQALSLAAAPRIVRPGVKSPTTFAISSTAGVMKPQPPR